MPGEQGTPVYNPKATQGTNVDANLQTYGTTTLNGAVSSGGSTLTLTAASVFANGQWLTLDVAPNSVELVQVQSGGGTTTLTIVGTLQYNHSSGATVALVGARQVVSIGDPTTAANFAAVNSSGQVGVVLGNGSFVAGVSLESQLSVVDGPAGDILAKILCELKIQTLILNDGFNSGLSLDDLRSELLEG